MVSANMSGNLDTLKKIAHAKMADAKINWETFEYNSHAEAGMKDQLEVAISKIKPLERVYEEIMEGQTYEAGNKSKAELDAEYRYVQIIEQDLMTGYQFEWLLTVYNNIKEVTK